MQVAQFLDFYLILDVQNVSNKCSAENPCEDNSGNCTFDNECWGNLICSNCEGSSLCCQEPGDDKFRFRNHLK